VEVSEKPKSGYIPHLPRGWHYKNRKAERQIRLEFYEAINNNNSMLTGSAN
jgi:hypothetical protein